MPAPQLVPTPAKVDALNEPTRARVHLAHLSTQQIEAALRRCGGSLTQAAEKLNVGRTTLYLRTVEEPSLLETRAEILESLIDNAEGAIVAALAGATSTRQRLSCERKATVEAGARGRAPRGRADARAAASQGRHDRGAQGAVAGGADAARGDRRQARGRRQGRGRT